ncbi:E3 ubiquitin-protein ligase UBR1 [Thelohanellus kitauei]|uniref:E3 ubiquitin-protein ligase n=1 Tax=Thelohanellus kitauei TaxID=669202 RepID=A0A0C2N573_THEKT|nr:E3 ubiquitin-protein ligase UBR1 [Thelohanellus kitauei]
MTNELNEEEINNRIDLIIIRALLITSNEHQSDPRNVYSDARLQELVIQRILFLCFENVDSETKKLYFSNNGGLGRCTKLLKRTQKAQTCKDCCPDISSSLCEECFRNSEHVIHNHVPGTEKYKLLCHCGDSEVYKNSPPCSMHEIPKNSQSLPEQFILRIRYIIRHLLKYLELLCGDESLLDEHVKDWLLRSENLQQLTDEFKLRGIIYQMEEKGATTNTHRSCLMIFRPENENHEYAYSCVRFANPPGILSEQLLRLHSCGYLCVMYKHTSEDCEALSVKIQQFIHDSLPGSGMYCRFIKVHMLFFMKLSSCLIHLIKDTCLRKSELCDVMSEIVFETSLPEKLFFNTSLWKEIRYNLTYRIVLPSFYSRPGALNFSKFYLQNFYLLYSELLVNNDLNDYLFSLATHFAISKLSFTYLVQNGVLFKILDFISCILNQLGLGRGQSISNVLKKTTAKDINLVYELAAHFNELISLRENRIDDTPEIKSELQRTATRLVQFCIDFDDMEPLTQADIYRENEIPYHKTYNVIRLLHNILASYVNLFLSFDEMGNMIISQFVKIFKIDMQRITANLSPQKAIEKLVTLSDFEKKPFSIFNMSQRLFFDILTECVVKRNLSDELKNTILQDQAFLIFVSQAAMTSLSLEMYFKAGRFINPSNYFRCLLSTYHSPKMVHYLYMQDFNAIQFLISCLTPENFLKYVLFNVFPSIREKTTVYESLSSILSLQELDYTSILQQIFILIYNALTEMRLVGDLDDPDSYFIKRQLIHILAYEDKTEKYLRKNIYIDRSSFRSSIPQSKMSMFDEILSGLSETVNSPLKKDIKMLNNIYLDPGSPFYHLNTTDDTRLILNKFFFMNVCITKGFILPKITELRPEFKGMDDFLFSKTFLSFILEVFVKYYRNSELWKKDTPDLFLFVILILCLIIRVSKARTISDNHHKRMLEFFGPQPQLDNRSFLDILKSESSNFQSVLVMPMVDRFIKLSV